LVGLAAWPFTTRLGTGLAAGLGAARFQPAAMSGTTTRASATGDLPADFDQHLPWAHGQFSHRAVWPKSQVGVRQVLPIDRLAIPWPGWTSTWPAS
jgi:hypothetical protein